MRKSNKERSESMRQSLMDAARKLFVERGYAETTTPDIVASAGVTRGALYHHFEDKKALLRAVIEREAAEVSASIELHSRVPGNARATILEGTRAYCSRPHSIAQHWPSRREPIGSNAKRRSPP